MSCGKRRMHGAALLAVTLALATLVAGPAFGHCDAMDGPVVKEAQVALEKGDATPLLKWVGPEDEGEIRRAFQQTLAVRKLGDEAKELADMYFFETLVRLHRSFEGAPYTGVKPAGTPVPAPVARADEALEKSSVDDLAERIAALVETGIRERFAATVAAGERKDESVEAGRAYVEAYVDFVHYVKGVHDVAAGQGGHHGHEAAAPACQH